MFLLEGGERLALKRSGASQFVAPHRRVTDREMAGRAEELSPNAVLRPVMQDYLLPTAAYIGGPAELAYLARIESDLRPAAKPEPAAFPRAGFTLIDDRSSKRMQRYQLGPTELFVREQKLHDTIATRLVPPSLHASLDRARQNVAELWIRSVAIWRASTSRWPRR